MLHFFPFSNHPSPLLNSAVPGIAAFFQNFLLVLYTIKIFWNDDYIIFLPVYLAIFFILGCVSVLFSLVLFLNLRAGILKCRGFICTERSQVVSRFLSFNLIAPV